RGRGARGRLHGARRVGRRVPVLESRRDRGRRERRGLHALPATHVRHAPRHRVPRRDLRRLPCGGDRHHSRRRHPGDAPVTAPRCAEPTCSAYFASTPVTGARFGCLAFRLRNSETGTWRESVPALASMRMRSPLRTSAIGPPAAASGETWPIIIPRVAPEKRPSVSSATFSPIPCP